VLGVLFYNQIYIYTKKSQFETSKLMYFIIHVLDKKALAAFHDHVYLTLS